MLDHTQSPLTWPCADPTSDRVHGKQPLTSVEAFALALVEASSRLSLPAATTDDGEAGMLPDELLPAAE